MTPRSVLGWTFYGLLLAPCGLSAWSQIRNLAFQGCVAQGSYQDVSFEYQAAPFSTTYYRITFSDGAAVNDIVADSLGVYDATRATTGNSCLPEGVSGTTENGTPAWHPALVTVKVPPSYVNGTPMYLVVEVKEGGLAGCLGFDDFASQAIVINSSCATTATSTVTPLGGAGTATPTRTPSPTPTPSPTATCAGAGSFWDPLETITVDPFADCGLNFNPPTAGDYTTSSLLPAGDYRVNLVPNFCAVYNGSGTIIGAGLRFGTLVGASFTYVGAFGQQPIVPVNSCADVWFGGPNASPGSVFHASLASPGRLYFVVGDTNCSDNSGSVRVMIEALVTTVPCGTATISPSPSPSRTPSASRTPSHSATPSRSVTVSPSASPTATLVSTVTASPSPSASPSATLVSTVTASPSPTNSPTSSATPTVTATAVLVPPTATPEGDFFLSPLASNPNPSYGDGGLYFAWRLGAGASISISVYTVSGQLVRQLEPLRHQAGAGERFWDGRNDHGMPVASGSYFARIKAEKEGHEPKLIWEKAAILR